MDTSVAVLAGPASVALGAKVCEELAVTPAVYDARRFPDGEGQVELGESVRGRDVFVIQATSPPADVHVMDLLLLPTRAGATAQSASPASSRISATRARTAAPAAGRSERAWPPT